MNDRELTGKVHSAVYLQCRNRGFAAPVDVLMDVGYLSKCQRHLKMSFSAEIKCHFSPGSIQVYTALITDRLVGLKPVKS